MDKTKTIMKYISEINLSYVILQKAFKGELVPQDPNDEPASVLLELVKGEKEISTKK